MWMLFLFLSLYCLSSNAGVDNSSQTELEPIKLSYNKSYYIIVARFPNYIKNLAYP